MNQKIIVYFISVTAKLGSCLKFNEDDSSSAAVNYQVTGYEANVRGS